MKATGKQVIPPQHTGIKSDVTHEVNCKSIEEAKSLYNTAKERLLNVSNWKEISGTFSAAFQLTDSDGHPLSRLAQRGDKFLIDIPAPGNHSGDGFDWVEVEEILTESDTNSDTESTSMRVRPTTNPLTPPEENDTAHFYTEDATSSFIVKRSGTKVSAEVHGRNEKPNTSEAENVIDKTRNALVAVGAILGLHKPQWNGLVEGLLEMDD